MAWTASMPTFEVKTGYHDQRVPAGKAPRQDQRPQDRALAWAEQPPCSVLRATRATIVLLIKLVQLSVY